MAEMVLPRLFPLLNILIHLIGVMGHRSDTQSAGCGREIQPNTVVPTVPASTSKSVIMTKSSHYTSKRRFLDDFLSSILVKRPKDPALVDIIGASYIAHVTVGTKTVPLLIDTGSSDLWVAPNNFICLDADSHTIEQSACGFHSFVEDTFSGGVVPDEYISIFYGNGQFTHGPYGLESISLGGITVPSQQIALPSEGYIKVASGDFAGILGLGYPGMVAARKGKKPKPYVNNTDPLTTYDTWFGNAVKQNLTEPLFSIALNMNGGGLLAIGGVVDVPIQGGFAATPILMVSHLSGIANTVKMMS